ncbi:MAG: CHAT domain-containing protein [Cyanobacteria bacterium J06614_10]
MIQEFGISITAVGGDQYLVRTENVEKGVQLAEERVHWPVTQWLEQTKSLMHDPLLGLLQGQQSRAIPTRAGASRRPRPDSDSGLVTLVQLGQTLHNELFKGQLHDSWITAQGVAQNHQDLLRLRIGIKDNRLQQLPWEALHAGTRPLATGTDVIFSRYILDPRQEHSIPQVKPSTIGQVLRILMVIASPEDQERLELKQEVHHLQAELEPDELGLDDSVVDVRLKILEQPGRAELTQELERGNYQVLHYAGHSNLGNAGGDLYLVSRQTGLTERLSGEDLAGLLVNNGIKLAVFNSCRGGYSSSSEEGWQERNLAQALVNRGMPGVIAMTERIPDHVAITFTELLYRNLKKGQSIDLSLNRTRQGLISAYGSNQFYWALPTLYMHPLFDGYLVRTTGDLENTDVLDSANDPFGDMFSEPGLSEIDLPVRQRPPIATDSMVMRSKQADNGSGQPASGQSASAGSQKEEGQTPASPQSASTSDTASATKAAIQKLSTPLAPVDVDGELQVPENIETPEGFYGDLSGVAPAMPSLEKVAVADAPKPVSTPTEKDKASPAEDDVPELVGERLTRSHTVHTRLLTVPGIATMVLVALLGITTVAWAQRALRTPRREPVPETLGELGLPAQIEVSLNQNDLDAAAVATKALIDQGDYLQAIAALETADRRQQEDVIVSFFRGRAQWGLAKQGRDNFSADDAMRSWMTALDSESDWMEITMALGFAHYAVGREQLALEAWERAIDLAQRQLDAKGAYFSDQSFGEYVLNAHAGVAMSALSLSKIEADPAVRNQLLEQASIAYRRVISEAPSEFNASALGNNWLWLGGAIADWEEAKEELSQTVEIE